MDAPPHERELVRRAQSRLAKWATSARAEAYGELFDGDDAILSADEVSLLDALDSEMERRGGDGLWGTDQYGVHTAGPGGSDAALGVVCVYHPQITSDSVIRGADRLDDETEERLNAALWRYAERVASLVEADLEAFVRRTQD